MQESDAAGFHCPSFDPLIFIRGHEYDRQHETAACQLTCKIDTATIAELNIDNEAVRCSCHHRIEELFGGRIEFRVISVGRQQTAHGAENAKVIVNYRNSLFRRHWQ